jgi:hypothetical protein
MSLFSKVYQWHILIEVIYKESAFLPELLEYIYISHILLIFLQNSILLKMIKIARFLIEIIHLADHLNLKWNDDPPSIFQNWFILCSYTTNQKKFIQVIRSYLANTNHKNFIQAILSYLAAKNKSMAHLMNLFQIKNLMFNSNAA